MRTVGKENGMDENDLGEKMRKLMKPRGWACV
jgi:hypothetical protein